MNACILARPQSILWQELMSVVGRCIISPKSFQNYKFLNNNVMNECGFGKNLECEKRVRDEHMI